MAARRTRVRGSRSSPGDGRTGSATARAAASKPKAAKRSRPAAPTRKKKPSAGSGDSGTAAPSRAGKRSSTKAARNKKAPVGKPAKSGASRRSAPKKTAAKRASAKKAAGRKPATKPKTGAKPAGSGKRPAAKKPAARVPAENQPKVKKPVENKTVARPKGSSKKPASRKAPASRETERPGLAANPGVLVLGDRSPAGATVEEEAAPKQFQRTYRTWLGRLISLRHRLMGETAQLEDEALHEHEVSADHMADAGTDSYEQDFTLSLIQSKSEALRDVDAAIGKIDRGVYGLCEECGILIPKGRLEILPHARFCIECKSRLEQQSTGFWD